MTLPDHTVRSAAFKWLGEQATIFGDVLERERLLKGFIIQDVRIPLLSPQGIFKPKVLAEYPLSITTTTKSPYNDSFEATGLLSYRYRGTDPHHPDNEGLRKAMINRVPLIYFHGITPGKYFAFWPVFIVGDSPQALTFTVAVDDIGFVRMTPGDQPTLQLPPDTDAIPRRAYITFQARKRLHQQGFRERVLDAYRSQCACCRLHHRELLDAAHIIPDSDPEGIPSVKNGLSLCKLHHAAFDSFFFGITPDYIIKVRKDVLREADGPMLEHGLQGMDNQKIILPQVAIHQPDRLLLERRFEQFKQAH